MVTLKDFFTCEECNNRFRKAWSDEEMLEESARLFPMLQENERAVVCDDCFNILMEKQDDKPDPTS